MQHTIFTDQTAVVQAGLADGKTDLDDWAIVNYLRGWWRSGKGRTVDHEGVVYTWVNYGHAISENPLIRARSKSGLARRFKKLHELGVLRLHKGPENSMFAAAGAKLELVERIEAEHRENGFPKAVERRPTQGELFDDPTPLLRKVHSPVNQGAQPLLTGVHSTNQVPIQSSYHTQRAAPAAMCVAEATASNKPPDREPSPERKIYDRVVAAIRKRCGAFEERTDTRTDLRLIRRQIDALGEERITARVHAALAAKPDSNSTIRWLDREGWTIGRLFSSHTLQILGAAGKLRAPSARSPSHGFGQPPTPAEERSAPVAKVKRTRQFVADIERITGRRRSARASPRGSQAATARPLREQIELVMADREARAG